MMPKQSVMMNPSAPDEVPAETQPEQSVVVPTRPYLKPLTRAVMGLFIIALLAAMHIGKPVLLPLATALLLSFVLRPLVRVLGHIHVPPPLSSLILVLAITGILAVTAYGLADPASQWLQEAPRSLHQLQLRLEEVKQPMKQVQEATAEVEKLGNVSDDENKTKVVVDNKGLNETLLTNARQAAVGVITTLVLLFFILGWGDRLYRNVINALPRFHEQRQAVLIAQEIESSISTYLATITVINLLLGAVVAGMLHLMQMPNPVLWGVTAGLLNFLPYFGPAVTTLILTFVALLSYPTLSEALLVPAMFLLITSIEGYFVTPLAVGTRLTLNPLLIFVSVVFWYWMWGIVGALLTVPILVCIKVTLDRVDTAKPVARILD